MTGRSESRDDLTMALRQQDRQLRKRRPIQSIRERAILRLIPWILMHRSIREHRTHLSIGAAVTLALAEETETAYMSKNYDPCLGNGEGLLICSVLRVIVIANNKGASSEKEIRAQASRVCGASGV